MAPRTTVVLLGLVLLLSMGGLSSAGRPLAAKPVKAARTPLKLPADDMEKYQGMISYIESLAIDVPDTSAMSADEFDAFVVRQAKVEGMTPEELIAYLDVVSTIKKLGSSKKHAPRGKPNHKSATRSL